MPSGKVVVDANPIEERQSRLRELEIVLRVKNSGACMQDCDEWSKIDGAENANKSHVGLAAVGGSAIPHGHRIVELVVMVVLLMTAPAEL